MLAGQFTAPRKIELVEVPEPELVEDGQIIFQPEITCLCGSDLPFFDPDFEGHEVEMPGPVGHSLHEMVGSVVATNGTKFKAGDRALVVPEHQMGLFERYAISEDRGIHLDVRIDEEHAMLAQPFGTVLFALKKLPNLLDLDVAVVGQGPIGQLFNIGLRNMGCRHIIGIDPLESRLKTSPLMGATETVCNANTCPVETVREICDGQLPDIVIEAVGHKAHAFNLCTDLCRKFGKILYFGVSPTTVNGVRWRDLMLKNITVVTSLHPDFVRDFPLAMRWIGEGRVDLRRLVTHRYQLNDIQEAFDTFRDRVDGAQKVVIEFPAKHSAKRQTETTD